MVTDDKRPPQPNNVIAGRDEAGNIQMISSCSSSILPKSSGEQTLVEDFLDSNGLVLGVKDRWQMAHPQSYYHPPENRMYKVSDDLHVKQRYFSSGQQSSPVFSNTGVSCQQLSQVTTSSFPMGNSASFNEPFLNQQSSGHLQIVKDIGKIPYSLQHVNSIEQSTALHSSTNNHLAESDPFSSHQQQLIDQNRVGVYRQQLQNNLYFGVRFPNSGNPPVAEQHAYPAFAPMDHRYNNWSIEGDHQLHNNNLSGLEPADCLNQALPSESSADGSLFCAISQYRHPPVNMQPRRLSPGQLLETGNQVLLFHLVILFQGLKIQILHFQVSTATPIMWPIVQAVM